MRFKRSAFVVAILAAGGSLPVAAEPLVVAQLDTLVVTHARTPQTVHEASAAVTVFDRDDIEHSAARTLDELLVGVPGVAVANSGGYGKQTGLFLRGTGSNHTLVLIDGVRINTGQEGAALIQHIPLSQVERVEVVRGPRSSLYGSDALGGVIQIFTRKPDAPFEASSSATIGSEGTTEFTQYLGGLVAGTRWHLNLGSFSTDGIDSRPGFEPDDDGFDNQSVSAGLSHRFGALELGARLYRSEGGYDYDNADAGDNSSDFIQQTLSGHADYQVSDTLNIGMIVSRATERRKDYLDREPRGASIVGVRDSLLITADQALSDDILLTLGLERTQDQYEQPSQDYGFGPGPEIDRDRYNNAVFAQVLGDWARLNYQVALRYDENEQFGEQVTGNVAVGYRITSYLQPYVSYGTAFVTPTFLDLYYPGASNPNLDPEEGETVEVGLKGRGDSWRYGLAAYYSEIEELILFSGMRPENMNSTRITGVEASLAYSWRQWWFEAAAGYTRAIDAATGKQLIRRPKWSGRVSVRRELGHWSLRADVRSQGASADNRFNPDFTSTRVRLAGFGLTDLAATWNARENLELEAKVSNAFDQEAVTVAGYNSRGRLVLGTVRYTY